jgi:hypothetical protein
MLRREVPSRSVSQLIQIMEWEGLIEKGQIRRSTLQEKLTERGYSTRQMRMYAETGVATRRWQQPHRNRLWQSFMNTAYLRLDLGQPKAVYRTLLGRPSVGIARRVLSRHDMAVVEDCFRRAVRSRSGGSRLLDNGSKKRST